MQLPSPDSVRKKYFKVARCSQCMWYEPVTLWKGHCKLLDVIVTSNAISCKFFNMSLKEARKHGLNEYLASLQKYKLKRK